VVSLLAVSLAVLSVVGVDIVAVESALVLSPLPAARSDELHPAATVATIAVIKAKLKNCFFIGLLFC
jgi:hypothetical protein